MSASEREGLIRRIRQVRRAAAARRSEPTPIQPETERVRALEFRIARLEQVVEGLKDSVRRQGRRIAEFDQ